jgi:hypothetical protein
MKYPIEYDSLANVFSFTTFVIFCLVVQLNCCQGTKRRILYNIFYLGQHLYLQSIVYRTRNLTFPINTAPIFFDQETLSVVSRIV